MGRQAALRWIAEGTAIVRSVQKFELGPECGIVARGEARQLTARLEHYGIDCQSESIGAAACPEVRHPKTLLWQPEVKLRVDLIPAGFGFLDRWEVACPLFDHQTIAAEVGSKEERGRTESVIGDLRVPLYNPSVIFARECQGTRATLQAWHLERQGGRDERLAWLRALWKVKPLVLALPRTWIE